MSDERFGGFPGIPVFMTDGCITVGLGLAWAATTVFMLWIWAVVRYWP
jgi:hypothetical protein